MRVLAVNSGNIWNSVNSCSTELINAPQNSFMTINFKKRKMIFLLYRQQSAFTEGIQFFHTIEKVISEISSSKKRYASFPCALSNRADTYWSSLDLPLAVEMHE